MSIVELLKLRKKNTVQYKSLLSTFKATSKPQE